MKAEDGTDVGELDRPVFVHHHALREIEQQLYGHVLAAVDLDKLSGLEQLLWMLFDDLAIDDALALDLTKQLIASALARVAQDPDRHMASVPYGVTKEEAAAVAFDDACLFCRAEAAADQRAAERAAAGDADEPDEPCACCDELVRAWRAEHAEVLAKHGLGPPAEHRCDR